MALNWDASGRVGIGASSIASTTNKLTLQGDIATTPADQLTIRGNTDTTKRLNIGFDTTGNQATLQSYTATSTAGNLLLNPSGGNVGIGTTAPGFPLSFANSLGNKISLYGSAGGPFVGFGVLGRELLIHSDIVESDIRFGYGSSSSFNETMRIKGNGNVGIGTTTPTVKLDVAGDIKSNGKPVPVAEENLRIIRGTVAGSGERVQGTGFTSAPIGSFVRVTFPAGTFSGVPTVVVSPVDTAAGYTQYVGSISATGFDSTGSFSGVSGASRQNFTFIAIGPR
jgi:hypothetical protein